jgi:GTPase SAR1 family protein
VSGDAAPSRERELSLKIVFAGPGLGGKTTNLRHLHGSLPEDRRGRLISLDTDDDRTIFFDYLPVDVGSVAGFQLRLAVYTVPGQELYRATRALVLRDADGIVFVADSHPYRMEANVASLEDLRAMWLSLGQGDLADAPLVFQYNKRDLPGRLSLEELEEHVNVYDAPFVPSIAIDGKGVSATLKQITRLSVHRALSTQRAATGRAAAGGDAAAASAS